MGKIFISSICFFYIHTVSIPSTPPPCFTVGTTYADTICSLPLTKIWGLQSNFNSSLVTGLRSSPWFSRPKLLSSSWAYSGFFGAVQPWRSDFMQALPKTLNLRCFYLNSPIWTLTWGAVITETDHFNKLILGSKGNSWPSFPGAVLVTVWVTVGSWWFLQWHKFLTFSNIGLYFIFTD